jgi:hypothetical protein
MLFSCENKSWSLVPASFFKGSFIHVCFSIETSALIHQLEPLGRRGNRPLHVKQSS